MFVPYAMGRLESLWPDALKFDPSRHLDAPRPSNFKFTAFQVRTHDNTKHMLFLYVELGILHVRMFV